MLKFTITIIILFITSYGSTSPIPQNTSSINPPQTTQDFTSLFADFMNKFQVPTDKQPDILDYIRSSKFAPSTILKSFTEKITDIQHNSPNSTVFFDCNFQSKKALRNSKMFAFKNCYPEVILSNKSFVSIFDNFPSAFLVTFELSSLKNHKFEESNSINDFSSIKVQKINKNFKNFHRNILILIFESQKSHQMYLLHNSHLTSLSSNKFINNFILSLDSIETNTSFIDFHDKISESITNNCPICLRTLQLLSLKSYLLNLEIPNESNLKHFHCDIDCFRALLIAPTDFNFTAIPEYISILLHEKYINALRLKTADVISMSENVTVTDYLNDNLVTMELEGLTTFAFWQRQFKVLDFLIRADCPYPANFTTDKENLKMYPMRNKFVRKLEIRRKIIEKFHEDIKNGDIEDVRKFLEANKSIRFARNEDNKSALKIAFENEQLEIYALLKSRGLMMGNLEEIVLKYKEIHNFNNPKKTLIRHSNYKLLTSAAEENDNYIEKLVQKSKFNYDPTLYTKDKIISEIRKAFVDVNATTPEILEICSKSNDLIIIFDFEYSVVDEFEPGSVAVGLAQRQYDYVVIAANEFLSQDINDRFYALGTLSHELMHYAMFLVYDNDASPYLKDDLLTRNLFRNFTEKCKKFEKTEPHLAYPDDSKPDDFHIELIARVPDTLLMRKNQPLLLDIIKDQFSELFDFYYGKILQDMRDMTVTISDREKVREINQWLDAAREIEDFEMEIIVKSSETDCTQHAGKNAEQEVITSTQTYEDNDYFEDDDEYPASTVSSASSNTSNSSVSSTIASEASAANITSSASTAFTASSASSAASGSSTTSASSVSLASSASYTSSTTSDTLASSDSAFSASTPSSAFSASSTKRFNFPADDEDYFGSGIMEDSSELKVHDRSSYEEDYEDENNSNFFKKRKTVDKNRISKQNILNNSKNFMDIHIKSAYVSKRQHIVRKRSTESLGYKTSASDFILNLGFTFTSSQVYHTIFTNLPKAILKYIHKTVINTRQIAIFMKASAGRLDNIHKVLNDLSNLSSEVMIVIECDESDYMRVLVDAIDGYSFKHVIIVADEKNFDDFESYEDKMEFKHIEVIWDDLCPKSQEFLTRFTLYFQNDEIKLKDIVGKNKNIMRQFAVDEIYNQDFYSIASDSVPDCEDYVIDRRLIDEDGRILGLNTVIRDIFKVKMEEKDEGMVENSEEDGNYEVIHGLSKKFVGSLEYQKFVDKKHKISSKLSQKFPKIFRNSPKLTENLSNSPQSYQILPNFSKTSSNSPDKTKKSQNLIKLSKILPKLWKSSSKLNKNLSQLTENSPKLFKKLPSSPKVIKKFNKNSQKSKNLLLDSTNNPSIPEESQQKLMNPINTTTFILASPPGSGKSTTLKEMTSKIREISPTFWIAYINLTAIDLKSNFSPEEIPEFLSNNVLKLSKLESVVFSHLLSDNRVVLIFDEFDKIDGKSMENSIEIFKFCENQQVKIWISTRPKNLKVIGHSLKNMKIFKLAEFSKSDREKFLEFVDDEKEVEVAEFLEMIGNVGNPQMIHEIVDAFMLNITNFYQIYSQLVLNRNFGKSILHQKFNDIGELLSSPKKLLKAHQNIALSYFYSVNFYDKTNFTNLEEFCIIYSNFDGRTEFIHESYAAYFVAQYFAEELFKTNEDANIWNLLIKATKFESWKLVGHFLNDFIELNSDSLDKDKVYRIKSVL